MVDLLLSYREVIPDQTNPQIWKDINLNTGATQSTLQDIKVAEKAGGYYYKTTARNRFIYWRTNRDVLELSEISLDVNLVNSNIRYKFTDSPVLAVSIFELTDNVVILVSTVSSIHYLKFNHPNRISKNHDDVQVFSIFHEAVALSTRDSSLYYVIGHAATPNHPFPHTAACWLGQDGRDAYFALAYQSNVTLFSMNCSTGQTGAVDLKEQYIMPRILSNLTGALRKRGSASDSQYATSLIFSEIGDSVFLYGLYRDDNIRMWSTRTAQCLSTINCIQNFHEARVLGSQTNTLRRVSADTICAFLCSSTGSEFVTLRTISNGGSNYSLQQIDFIPAPEFDLVEFDINENRIWGLWCNSQGEFNVSSFSLLSIQTSDWVSAGLEMLPERFVKVDQGMDPRQAYCSYIFYPGRFQRDVIDKALIMFRRSNIMSDPNIPLSVLRDRVCSAVEQEVQNEMKDYDDSDELYIEISFKYWEKFYSCCEQYHIKSCQPIGLVPLEAIGAVAIVKKNSFSLLRPCELLEHLMLVGGNVKLEHLPELALDDEVTADDLEDLLKLVSILTSLEQHISDDDKSDIDTKLFELETPNIVFSDLISDILLREYEQNVFPREFLLNLTEQVKLISQLPSAMILLLKLLRLDDGQPEAMMTYSALSHSSRQLLATGNLFSSNTGISVLAESIRQNTVIRYSLCRNLFILQSILNDSNDLQSDTAEIIRSKCMKETKIFAQAYYVMVWICVTAAVPPSSSALDASINRLSHLHLSDGRYKQRSNNVSTILEQFLRGKGAVIGLSLLVESDQWKLNDFSWQCTLIPLSNIIAQLIWAVSGNFIFGEWLIGSCQHSLVQEYVRLLNSWCEWNKCSRNFICAVSLLENGEPYKAYDQFTQFSITGLEEPFLQKVLFETSTCTSPDDLTTQYYLKVIQLFEQHSSLDCIIRLAQSAIDNLKLPDSQLAMFQSIVFTNHLQLEHYNEAYESLIQNVEPARRRDCLRQLVVRLFERRRLDLLMNFSYKGLQDELENIVESRARSMSITNNVYYDFLYALHVCRSNMRKAASIIYEQALRFALECDTLAGVERRYECLLACVTTLNLVDDNYKWIARPAVNDEPRPSSVDQMETDELTVPQNVTILELKDLRRELLLTDAIISLTKHRKELSSIINADVNELIPILANTGLYTVAIKLAKEHGRTVENILQSLAFACTQATDDNPNETWTWLQENDLADLPHKNSAKDMAWSLLQYLINQNELKGSSKLHKDVASKILSLGEYLPHWLYLSYRSINPTELLSLYVNHGRLVEATELAKEFILAMTRTGGEYFGLANALHSTTPAMCFPVNTIDVLLHNLHLNAAHDTEYQQLHSDLEDIVGSYIKSAATVSQNKIEYAR